MFVNDTLIHESSPESCRELSNSELAKTVCVSTEDTYSVVNCIAPDSSSIEGPLLCFQFLRFSEQPYFFESVAGAVVLYFVSSALHYFDTGDDPVPVPVP